jgi:nicotinate-nucleotide adenylyltransferase
MKKKIGFLGGTFDPVHFGHLNMAVSLLEAHHLDEVLFCPAYTSPFKTAQPPAASAEHRFSMLASAVQHVAGFSVLDWEIAERRPCFTIDTMKRLQEETDADLFLLLGEDQLHDLHRWKQIEELLSFVRPLVASRDTKAAWHSELPQELQSLIAQGRTPISMMDMSSTAIRKRLKERLYCGHLVPALVLDYIERHRLYY